MKLSTLSCVHPLFRWSSQGGWHESGDLKHPYVFVFERSHYLTPTPEQIAKYWESARIVERLGGRMNQREWEIAGKAEVLSAEDVRSILESVRQAYPDAKVIEHWNGEGCYTMSVGVDLGEPMKKAN